MKKETKELVKWIETQINLASHLDQSYHITKQAEIVHNEMENKAYDFLDSLPDIEKKLCFGGYIQDKNGTPCCHGDKVIVIDENGKNYYGRLIWSDINKVFRIQNAKERKEFYFPVVFEKVGLFKAGE